MARHTVTLPCIADAYVDQEYPGTNYGNATQLLVGHGWYSTNFDYYKKALFRFNPTTLPERKKIIQANLGIFVVSKNVDKNGNISTGLAESFDENTVTYNSAFIWGTTYETNNPVGVIQTNQYQFLQTEISLEDIINRSLALHIKAWGKPSDTHMYVASRESSNPPQLIILYEDIPPSKPNIIEPVGRYIDNKTVIRLIWRYVSSVGGLQNAFDLQWSTNQTEWTTISQVTPNTYYDIPAETFPAGNIYWRVRTANEYGEFSEYSDIAAFYAIGAPSTPTILSVTNSARPMISWASDGQQVYQVQISNGDIVLYDTGMRPGINTRAHKAMEYLQDGYYTAKVWIKNEYDMISDAGVYYFTISVVRPPKPEITLQRITAGVEIYVAGSVRSLIYRKEMGGHFKVIGETMSGMFTDYTCSAAVECQYFARALLDSEAFTDSDIGLITPRFKGNYFAPVSAPGDYIYLYRYINNPPPKNQGLKLSAATVFYSGREFPVIEFSEHAESSMSFGFFLSSWQDVEKLTQLIKRRNTVIFRDYRGRKIYGILGELSINDVRRGFDVTFSMTRTDYTEEPS